MIAGSLVAVLAVTRVLTAAFQFGLPWWMGDRDSNHTFTNDHATYSRPDGAEVIESYRVDAMGHAWPGPHGSLRPARRRAE